LLGAALEGVAFAVRDATDCLLSSGPQVRALRLAGGGTTAPAWRQMLADILERPLTPIDVPAASGLGATVLARRAAALPEPSRDRRTGSAGATTYPRPERSRAYRDRYAAYRERVAALRPPAPAHASPSPVRHQTSGGTMRPTTGPPDRRACMPGAAAEAVERP
jgi:xylulokinase